MSAATPAIKGRVQTGAMGPRRSREAGQLLAASHTDYPAFRALFRGRERRRRLLKSFMTATSRDAAKHAMALITDDEVGALGVALWMPPGTFPLTALRKARMTPAMLRIALGAPGALLRFARVGAALEESVPSEPIWYLQVLGVHPRGQRSGIGGMLMEPGLTRADEAGLPCYLHTSDPANVAYYERFGFTIDEPDVGPHGGPTYISMIRSPSS